MKAKRDAHTRLLVLPAVAATACLTVAALGAASGALAFQSSKAAVSNNLSLGYVTTNLTEDFDPPTTVEQGKTYKKEVSVTNTSNTPIFVRVFVNVLNSNDQGIELSLNTEDWQFCSDDGYYYCLGSVDPKSSTPPLLKAVTTNSVSERTLDGFEVGVYEESVASYGFKTAKEAFASVQGGAS